MEVTIFSGARGVAADPRSARAHTFAHASDFLDEIARTASRECADTDAKLDSPAFALACWRPDATEKTWDLLAYDSATEVLAFDLDEMSPAELAAAAPAWAGIDATLYSTWKHSPDAPRLRLLVALDAPLPAADKIQYKRIYRAAAERLGLAHDTQTSSPCNLFFLPQHRPGAGDAVVNVRMPGGPLSLETLLEAAETARAASSASGESVGGATGARPDKRELKALVARWRRKKAGASQQAAGLALAAVVRSERYASDGHVYEITQHLAYQLAFDSPDLDELWFRERWLEPCWRVMWPGEDLSRITTDWINAWRSGLAARDRRLAELAEQRQRLAPAPAEDVDDGEVLGRVQAHAGALIVVHGSAYYVYDPRTGSYSAPVRAGGLAARARDLLEGLPGFSATEPRENGKPCAKGATQLIMDYGTAIDQVHYYARTPAGAAYDRDGKSIKVAAYRWNDFAPEYSDICDDLFRSMAGSMYDTLEPWLTKFRRLERCLPALVLVGPPGTWKSKTAQNLSRFWGPPDAPSPCRAGQVLGRFSAPLLENPVVWSDEELATDERGRAQPERYRESISEITHQVERKGVDPVTLHSALRHVIAVNDLDLVFSREVEGDAVRATMDRYLVVRIDGDTMRAFEARWDGTPEMDALREGAPVLRHVMWLERERSVADQGRFGVATHTDPDVLARAQFANDLLNLVLQVTTEAVLAEATRSVPGQDSRVPVRGGADGVLRFRPKTLVDLWADARAVRGYRGSAPTVAAVGRMLEGAGFRAPGSGGPEGFPLDWSRWAQWLRLSEIYDVREVAGALAKVLKSE